VTGFCEHGHEPLGSIKSGKLIVDPTTLPPGSLFITFLLILFLRKRNTEANRPKSIYSVLSELIIMYQIPVSTN
jgi:hypothetical protein